MSTTVKGIFSHLDCLVDAIDGLKREGLRDKLVVTAPLPRHEIEELLYDGKPSPVRWFTMVGAITGGIGGFTLCSLTHLNWPMIIPAGKPLVSIPAFIVITFETTVLWGCLATLIGLIVTARLPSYKVQRELEDDRLSDDKFGLIVNDLTGDQVRKVSELLHHTGAIEVTSPEAPAHA